MNLSRLIPYLILVLGATLSLGALSQEKQPEYRIGPGDTVRIQVYQNPDLGLETRVTENGMITFPLIGSAKIGGLTVSAAERVIADALRTGGFIKQPQVTVMPLLIRSNQVSVLGQVNRPGRYPLETLNNNVSEVLAIAGGIAPTGADIAIVTGTREGKPIRKEIDIAGMFLDNKMQDNLTVANGDVIYVPRAPTFYIYGEVQRPGSQRVERNMTIREALASGGGPTAQGSDLNLSLYRRGSDGKVVISTPDLSDSVRPDDVIYLSGSVFRARTESRPRVEEAPSRPRAEEAAPSRPRVEEAPKPSTKPAQ